MLRGRFFGARRTVTLIIVVGLLMILAGSLSMEVQAQTTGTIYGTVTDPGGASVVGATVTAKNLETNLERTTTTDGTGSYYFSLLSVGRYSLVVEAAGFRPHEETSLELQVQANLRVDVKLQLGALTERVVVTSETPQIDTVSTTLGKVVEERRIVDLPLNGRNFLQLGVLQAGVTPPIVGIDVIGSGTNNTPGGTKVNFSVNGMRITSNNHLLDGVNNVEPVSGAAMIVPSPDALQEFRILTNMYSAEFGRSGGSIVTVLTKKGTNSFHGSVYEFFRNDVLDARNFFTPEVPELKQNQFGATLGGPLVSDKTFFFTSYEGFRQRKGNPTSTPVPSLLVRQGDFSQEAVQPFDIFTGAPFPGGIIPPLRIDSVGQAVLNLYPEPNTGPNTWSGAPATVNDRDQLIVRADQSFAEGKNNLTVRYAFENGSVLIPNGHFTIQNAITEVPGFPSENEQRFQNFLIADTHSFTQKVINELRVSYARSKVAAGRPTNPIDPASIGFTFPVAAGNFTGAPSIAVTGHSGLGSPLISSRIYNFYEFTDNVFVTTGRHNLKFGVNIRDTNLFSDFPSLGFGGYNFVGAFTGNPLADIALGWPFFFLQAGGKTDKTLDQTSYYLYAQDDIRLKSNLTLNIGLRYELVPGFTEQDNLLLTFIPGVQSTLSPGIPTGLLRPGDPGIPRTLFPTDKNNLAPRIGLAWDPTGDGKTSVRAGYGIFYDESALVQEITVQQPPDFQPILFLFAPTLFPTSFGTSGTFADPYGGNSPFTPPIQFPLTVPPGTVNTWTDPNLKLAYIQHWNLTIQRQFTSSLAVEVAYVGNKGTNLQGDFDPNQAVWSPTADSTNVLQRRPFPQLGGSFQISPMLSSNYNGLQLTATQRPSHGLSFQASYTWSKAIDFQTFPNNFFRIPGQIRHPPDSRNLSLERGLSGLDVRHRFVLSYIYELPFSGNSTGAASHLLGGWRLNGIITTQSGTPFSVIDSADPNFDGDTANDRTDLVGNPNLPSSQQTAQRWFNTAAFSRIANAPVGTAGRNIIFTDGILNFDFGITKEFILAETRRIEFRWEAFNLFNHTSFTVPDTDFNSPSFGRVFRTATPERQLQFALKFIF